MRTILQRVTSASVTVDGEVVSSIGKGLLILAAVSRDDTSSDIDSMVKKITKAKLWDDESLGSKGRWKFNIKDIDGEILCVSQFTLHAHFQKGSKPDFHQSAGGEKARTFYDEFYKKLGEQYNPQKLQNGVFGAMMAVQLVNDGPVTIQFDTNPPKLEAPAQESKSSKLAEASDLANGTQ